MGSVTISPIVEYTWTLISPIHIWVTKCLTELIRSFITLQVYSSQSQCLTSSICFMQSTTTSLHWSYGILFFFSLLYFSSVQTPAFFYKLIKVNKTNLVISFNSFLYTNQLLYSSQLCHPSFYFNPPLVSWFLVTSYPHFLLHVPSALFYSLFPLVNIIFSINIIVVILVS